MISRSAFQLHLFCDSVVQHSISSTFPPGSYSVSQFDTVKIHAQTRDGLRVLPLPSKAIVSTPPDFGLPVHFSQQSWFYLFPDH